MLDDQRNTLSSVENLKLAIVKQTDVLKQLEVLKVDTKAGKNTIITLQSQLKELESRKLKQIEA